MSALPPSSRLRLRSGFAFPPLEHDAINPSPVRHSLTLRTSYSTSSRAQPPLGRSPQRTGAMQDPVSGLPRTHLLGTPMNRGQDEKGPEPITPRSFVLLGCHPRSGRCASG